MGYVCFVIDDGYNTIDSCGLVQEFKDRGLRFDIAINGNRLGTGRYLTEGRVKELQSEGFEILNHTADHKDLGFGKEKYSAAREQIVDHHEDMEAKGIFFKGFVAPYSIMDTEYFKYAKSLYTTAYTRTKGGPSSDTTKQYIQDGIDLFTLHRAGMYRYGVDGCKELIDNNDSLLVFYDHDPSREILHASLTTEEIMEVVDHARDSGMKFIKTSKIPDYIAGLDQMSFRSFVSGVRYGSTSESTVLPGQCWARLIFNESLKTDDLDVRQDGTIVVRKAGMYDIKVDLRITSPTWVWIALNLRPQDRIEDNYGNGTGAPRARSSFENTRMISYNVRYMFSKGEKFGIDVRANARVGVVTFSIDNFTSYSNVNITG